MTDPETYERQGFKDLFSSAPDGLRLHARDYRPPVSHHLPVVCLPGLARTAADFHELALALSQHRHRPRRVLAVDYRGRGLSAYDPDWKHYDIHVELSDVLSQLTVAGIPEAIFVGTSRGGLISMALSAVQPSVIRGVVLNDIGPVIEAKGLLRIRGYVGKLPMPRSFEEGAGILKQLADAQFSILGHEEWLRFARRTWHEADGRLVPSYDVNLLKGLEALDLEAVMPALWPLFEGLQPFRVLALRGANSDILSAQTLEEMKARHPRLDTLTVPGQGHAPLLGDHPTLTRIASFITQVEDEERIAA